MALTAKQRRILEIAFADKKLGKEVADRLDAVEGVEDRVSAAVDPLEQTISGTYAQAEVQDISDKVDELIAALQAAGLMAE
jgi:predicted ArsR family transcriptional regulator